MQDLTYRDALKNAAALKKLGMTEIYLSRDDDEMPWAHVVKVEPGGSHRLDMDTSVWFTAEDPKTKLRFRWSFEIEECSANGKGHYEIAAESCKAVFAKLNGKAQQQLANYFKLCAEKVREKGKEWQSYADRQKRDSETLELLGDLRPAEVMLRNKTERSAGSESRSSEWVEGLAHEWERRAREWDRQTRDFNGCTVARVIRIHLRELRACAQKIHPSPR